MAVISRRGFLSGLGSMLGAPAIVHAGNLMPVKRVDPLITSMVEFMGEIQASNNAYYSLIVHPSMYRDLVAVDGALRPDGTVVFDVPFYGSVVAVESKMIPAGPHFRMGEWTDETAC